MELTSAALWLNSFFSGYDNAILKLLHGIETILGPVLTPIMKLITLMGEKGLLMFLLAFALMCFAKSRKTGLCLFGAVCCGALITNIILKDSIARPRPFETVELYKQWWIAVGSPAEDGFSFPSGHMTACASGMTALTLMKGRKLLVPSVIIVFLMGVSRNYLMAHYPSDVLVATFVGLFSGFAAYFIANLIYHFLEAHDDIPLFAFVLDFDLPFRLPNMPGSYKGKHEK